MPRPPWSSLRTNGRVGLNGEMLGRKKDVVVSGM
jgi:hypothetical protein